MLYQVIHTHGLEDCPARTAEQTKTSTAWWQALKKTAGVKVLSGQVDPLEHTFYITVEADDYTALVKALGHLVSIGTGQIIPVINLDQAFPLADTGVFRSSRK